MSLPPLRSANVKKPLHDRFLHNVDRLIHGFDLLADLPLKSRNTDIHEIAPFL
jgi:hypothetical protein